jgi:hypothetical protein
MVFFTASFFGGFLLILSLAPEPWSALAFAWAFAHMLLQFLVFRCPHCRKLAVITPRGWSTPFVGDVCRHCGRPY